MITRTAALGIYVLVLACVFGCSNSTGNEFRPTHVAAMSGLVTDSSASPAPGLEIALGPDEHFGLAKTITATDGRYSLKAEAIFGQSEVVPDSVSLPIVVYMTGTQGASPVYSSIVKLPVAGLADTPAVITFNIVLQINP